MTSQRLTELEQEFFDLDDHDKLDLIVEMADELPPRSPERQSPSLPEQCRVQECQTPVYLWVELRQGRVHLEADVPKNSPLVRGLVTMTLQLVEGLPAEEALALPEDLLPVLGLESALGMTRQQGLRGVMRRIHREVQRLKDQP